MADEATFIRSSVFLCVPILIPCFTYKSILLCKLHQRRILRLSPKSVFLTCPTETEPSSIVSQNTTLKKHLVID